jgi:hypothetical protein
LIAGSVKVGLVAGALAATAGAALVVALAGFGLARSRAIGTTIGALASVQWMRGYFYGELKPAAQATFIVGLVLLTLSPLAALLGEKLSKKVERPALATLVRLAALAAPVVLALGLVLATSPHFAPPEGSPEGE